LTFQDLNRSAGTARFDARETRTSRIASVRRGLESSSDLAEGARARFTANGPKQVFHVKHFRESNVFDASPHLS